MENCFNIHFTGICLIGALLLWVIWHPLWFPGASAGGLAAPAGCRDHGTIAYLWEVPVAIFVGLVVRRGL